MQNRTVHNWKLEYERAALNTPDLGGVIMATDRKIQAVLNATIGDEEGRDVVENELTTMSANVGLSSFITGWAEGFKECAEDYHNRIRESETAFIIAKKRYVNNAWILGALIFCNIGTALMWLL